MHYLRARVRRPGEREDDGDRARERQRRRVFGRDVLLAPDDLKEGRGLVTLSLRQVKPGGKFDKAERNLAYLSRKAYRSFRFGTERG